MTKRFNELIAIQDSVAEAGMTLVQEKRLAVAADLDAAEGSKVYVALEKERISLEQRLTVLYNDRTEAVKRNVLGENSPAVKNIDATMKRAISQSEDMRDRISGAYDELLAKEGDDLAYRDEMVAQGRVWADWCDDISLAAKLTEEARTPLEAYLADADKLQGLALGGFISTETWQRLDAKDRERLFGPSTRAYGAGGGMVVPEGAYGIPSAGRTDGLLKSIVDQTRRGADASDSLARIWGAN